MRVITFEGVVENGKIRLPPEASLPERAKVYVIVPDPGAIPAAYLGSPHLAHPEQAKDFEKQILE
jgi:hypothetical protein